MLVLALAGCSSAPVMVAKSPPARYTVLGPVQGERCGKFSWFRNVELAYNEALAQRPGTRSLVRVEFEEGWRWGWLGVESCATIRGEAIK